MIKFNVFLPTYNRAAEVLSFVKNNSWFFVVTQSRLFILDNASTDETQRVVNILKKKNNFIQYIRYEDHVTAAENLMRSFKIYSDLRIWIMGDRYLIPKNIKDLSFSLSMNSWILMSSKSFISSITNHVSPKNMEIFNNNDMIISSSCLSSIIYPLGFIPSDELVHKAKKTQFPHTYMLMRAAIEGQEITYFPSICVLLRKSPSLNWAYSKDWFETGVIGWKTLIDSVVLLGARPSPSLYRVFSSHTSIGRWKGVLKRRCLGLSNFSFYILNFKLFTKMFSFKNFLIALMIQLIPMWFCKSINNLKK